MVKVIFTKRDSTLEKAIDVLPDSHLEEVREEVQMLLGLPINPPCKFVIEKTEKEFKNNLTFEEAGIQNNDKLILFSVDLSKNAEFETTESGVENFFWKYLLTDQKKESPQAEPTKASTLTTEVTSASPPAYLDWRTAIIIGGVIGIFILIGLFLSDFQNQQTDQVVIIERTPTPTPTPTPPVEKSKLITPSITFQPSPDSTISQEIAIQLVQVYLNAKKEMFAPPYDRKILAGIATNEFYEKAIGGINWLQREGSYYRYNIQRIESVEEFASQGNKATIKVKITEDYTLYNSDGSIDNSSSNFRTLTVIYNMIMINGKLKISASKIF